MKTDYVVVGAGIYGAATAWLLACSGASVMVVDERGIATRASGGPGRRGVRANGRDLRELALMPRAYDIWPDLHAQLGVAQFYQRCGHLLVAESVAHARGFHATAMMQRALGIATEVLDAEAVHEREPGLSDKVIAALYCPNDGAADHGATTRAYASAAQALGVEFRTNTRVTTIEVEHGTATAVLTSNGDRFVALRGVIVLANSGVPELLAPWVTLPVWSDCLQVLTSKPLANVPFRHLTGHAGRTVSLKTEGADRVMISGGWRGRWDSETQHGVATNEAIAGNIAEAIAVYPRLAGLQIDLADASHLETLTPDNIPIIDHVPHLANLWFATGWCGHGWAIAPVIAEHLTDWILGESRAVVLAPFSLSRFATRD